MEKIVTNHLIIQFNKGVIDSFIIQTSDTQNLSDEEMYEAIYQKLKEKFPEKKIYLEKYNFNYISNFSHWSAAGYPWLDHHIANYMMGRSPAHINPEFFHAVSSSTYRFI